MSPVKVRFTSHFKHQFNKFNRQKQLKIWNKIDIFKLNPFDTSLKTHKLTGRLINRWSFSINYSDRVLFEFITHDLVDFVDIGGHEIYK